MRARRHPEGGSRTCGWLAACGLSAALLGGGASARADGNADVGYTLLQSFLGSDLPTGAGVSVSMVEAVQGTNPNTDPYFPVSPAYVPSVASDPPTPDDFLFGAGTDPLGVGVTFIDGSNKRANGLSGHSAGQASVIFGNLQGLAPAVTQVTVYEANHYLNSVLNTNRTTAPLPQNFRVQNHSWVGSFGETVAAEDPQNVKALRRFDYAVDNANGGQGLTAVVGLNNFSNMPYLLSHSYNGIAVGRSDGIHSTGLTRTDDPAVPGDNAYGPGRSKPDLVAPKPNAGQSISTSSSTSHVSAIATMLHQSGAGTDAVRGETMKAILMAGATKEGFPAWTRTPSQPLDDTFGAGEVNVFHSYKIQRGGQYLGSTLEPVAAAGSYGWDYQTFVQNSPLYYDFMVEEGSRAEQFSVLLTWFARVDNLNSGLPTVANLNLALYDSSDGFLQTLGDPLAVSNSTVDNVEHIYLTDLGPGRYTLEITGDMTRDFGLAWRMEKLFDEPSADFDQDGVVGGKDYLLWQTHFNTLLGATRAHGDADGDGDVDLDDGNVLDAAFGIPLAAMAAVRFAAQAIPEAEGWLLACLGLSAWLGPGRAARSAPRPPR